MRQVIVGMILAVSTSAHTVPPRLASADVARSDAGRLDNFTCVITKTGAPEADVRGYVSYDNVNLVVGIDCAEPHYDAANELAQAGDPFNEAVELFVDANNDHHTYRQFRVSMLGNREYRLGMALTEAAWQAVVARTEAGWQVTISIPWALLGVTPKPGLVIGFNLNRIRMNTDPAEFACWAPTPVSFHTPAEFGDVVLDDYDSWLNSLARDRLADWQRRTAALFEQYPESTDGAVDHLAALQQVTAYHGIDSEAAALDALGRLSEGLEQAEALYRETRLAVIAGEFR